MPASAGDGSVRAAAVSRDGRRILVLRPGDGEGATYRAVVRDAESGQVVCSFAPASAARPYGGRAWPRFAFSADGRRLAAFGAGPGVQVWDATAGRELLVLGEGGGIVAHAAFTA